jgi:hypothetical protein
MSLPPDLVEMLGAFEDAGVRYLIIGGHAVSLHARPRTTKDLDVWLDARPENVQKACSALRDFGVPAEIVEALRTAGPDDIVWLGRVRRGWTSCRQDRLVRVRRLRADHSRVHVRGRPPQAHGDQGLARRLFPGRDENVYPARERLRAADAADGHRR